MKDQRSREAKERRVGREEAQEEEEIIALRRRGAKGKAGKPAETITEALGGGGRRPSHAGGR